MVLEVDRQLLELEGALVEGELLQSFAPGIAGVIDGAGDVEAFGANPGDNVPGGGVVHVRNARRVVRGEPLAGEVAGDEGFSHSEKFGLSISFRTVGQ